MLDLVDSNEGKGSTFQFIVEVELGSEIQRNSSYYSRSEEDESQESSMSQNQELERMVSLGFNQSERSLLVTSRKI